MSKLFLLIATVFVFVLSNGQNISNADFKSQASKTTPTFSKLKKTQGSTESDNICCSLEDKAGNLWFGTTGEGVYKFDGNTFKQYTQFDGLISNAVYSILEDFSGKIWIGTSDGICVFNGNKIEKKFILGSTFAIGSNVDYYTSKSKKTTIWSMMQDKSGKIWFGTGNGVYHYNGESFTRFLLYDDIINKDNLKLTLIDDMLQAKNGDIWFASGLPPGEEGVSLYDGKSIKGFKPNGDGWIRYIQEDSKGNLWFSGRNHGNFIYDGKSFNNFTEKVGIGNSILADKSGNIWFTGEEKQNTDESANGIWCYNGEVFKNYSTVDGMSKYSVWSMLEDKKGNIWIGTRNTGLYKFDGKSFLKFSE